MSRESLMYTELLKHTDVAAWILAAMNHLAPHRDNHALASALVEQLVSEHASMQADHMLKVASVEIAVMYRESAFDNGAIGDNGTSG